MDFISSCYWQPGENTSSLLLQQCRCDDLPILFACVCGGGNTADGCAGGYLSKQLLEWFRSLRLTRAKRNAAVFLKKQSVKLERLIYRTDGELECAGREKTVSLAGIFCLGQDCLIFGRGGTTIFLLNRSMGRASAEELPKAEKLQIVQGVMEPEAGLLLTTDSFAGMVPEKILKEGLFVEELRSEEQAGKHLRELGRAGEKEGGVHMAALFLCIRYEEQ